MKSRWDIFELTNQNSVKVAKVAEQTNKINWFKTLGTSVNNIPISPPYMHLYLSNILFSQSQV